MVPNPVDTRDLTLPRATLLACKLWSRTRVTQGDAVDTPCWVWCGKLTDSGYGEIPFKIDGGRTRKRPTHRVSAEIFITPFDPTLDVDHLCRNRACWNPSHLEMVTPTVNAQRAVNARQMVCAQRHEFTAGDAVLVEGKRRCPECQRPAMRRNKDKVPEPPRGWRKRPFVKPAPNVYTWAHPPMSTCPCDSCSAVDRGLVENPSPIENTRAGS